ncbi:MAG: hypothetical protein HQK54_15000 [Oligoflexales bacterium]|nr:hypothetical protein [Oligoflexales bacterium]
MKTRSTLIAGAILLSVFLAGCGPTDQNESALNSKGDKNACIDGLIDKLEIDEGMVTNPSMIIDILKNDMRLIDLPSLMAVIGGYTKNEVPLKPMFDEMREGIITKQPVVAEFICAAVNENLIPKIDESGKMAITKTLHHMLILNEMTNAMFKDPALMSDVRDHLYRKREQAGISRELVRSVFDIYGLSGDAFEPAKTKTIDWAFDSLMKFREKGTISENEIRGRQIGVAVNVMEVMIVDYVKGYKDNAVASIPLSTNPPETLSVSTDSQRIVRYHLNEEWVALYESWMAAFLTGFGDSLDIIYPKVFIPAVLNASNNDYLFKRVIALWPTINFVLFKRADKIEPSIMPGHDKLALRWGEINRRHAEDYYRKHNDQELRGVIDLFNPIRKRFAELGNEMLKVVGKKLGMEPFDGAINVGM